MNNPFPTPSGPAVYDGALPFPRGIFSQNPMSTPKYTIGDGTERVDYTDDMARLFIAMPASERAAFLESVQAQSGDATSVTLARALSSYGYVDFLMQNIAQPLAEKVDVIETVADGFVVYFFGESAPVWSYAGMLVNTREDDQAVNMFRLYRHILRGTELARRRKLVNLVYDSYIVSGMMLNLQTTQTADNELVVPFTFNLLVRAVRLRLNANDFGLIVPERLFDAKTMEDLEVNAPLISSMRVVTVPAEATAAATTPPTSTEEKPKVAEDGKSLLLNTPVTTTPPTPNGRTAGWTKVQVTINGREGAYQAAYGTKRN